MKPLKHNRAGLTGMVAAAGAAVCALYVCVSAWGQSAPALSIALTSSNLVTVSVTNGTSNGLYQIYYREFLTANYPWIFITNGTGGQTNFPIDIGDTVSGYFQAAYNSNFVTPTIIVFIQSPTNGALVQ